MTATSEPYTISRRESGLLFVRHPRFGKQIWTLSSRSVTAKYQERPCALCGVPLGESLAYYPLTNANNRMHRICTACGEQAT